MIDHDLVFDSARVTVRQTDNTGITLRNLSSKSSVAIVASCDVCGETWRTYLRDINRGLTSCPQCRRKSKSIWGQEKFSRVLKPVVADKDVLRDFSLVPSSDKTVDVRCPECSRVFRATVAALCSRINDGSPLCRICHPVSRSKTGELFASNNPSLAERSVERVFVFNDGYCMNDVLLQTKEEFLFRFDCGHNGFSRPLHFVRTQGRECLDCQRRRSEENRSKNRTVSAACASCHKTIEIQKVHLARNTSRNNGVFLCQDCARGSVSFAVKLKELNKVGVFWSPQNTLKPEDLTSESAKRILITCSEGHTWDCYAYAASGCPFCSTSKPEKELVAYIESLGDWEIVLNDRNVIEPQELDIYIPELSIAFEFNGLFWHTESKRGRSYHYDKFRSCQKKGIQLYTIWEDDWLYRRAVVERMIASKLGVLKLPKVSARECTMRMVSAGDARKFLDENHVQGFVSASEHLGMFNGDNLVAVMSFRFYRLGGRGTKDESCDDCKESRTVELVRFATSATVRGGFSRLLRKFLKDNPDVAKVVSFSDNCVSNGNLYSRNGFLRDGDIPPDYYYVYHGRRCHKSNFRRSRFKKDSDLVFREDLSESQMAELNGIEKVFDCGKVRWVLKA